MKTWTVTFCARSFAEVEVVTATCLGLGGNPRLLARNVGVLDCQPSASGGSASVSGSTYGQDREPGPRKFTSQDLSVTMWPAP